MGDPQRIEPGSKRGLLRVLVGFAVLLVLTITAASKTILDMAGDFLAPRVTGSGEVVIIEGEELLQQGAVTEALKLMAERRIARLILVIHTYSDSRMGFGIARQYGRLVSEEIERLGLKKRQYALISIPVAHPITLTEARTVLNALSREPIGSAVLLSRGFHTRRSFLLYREFGKAKGIRIIPWASSVDYPLREWWHHEDAVVDFVTQLAKLAYYLVRGYIPVASVFQDA